MQAEANDRRLAPALFTLIIDDFGKAAAPGAAGAPYQSRGVDRREVRQAIEMLGIAGVTQWQLAQCLARAFAHEPGRSDETLQRPLVTLESFDTRAQAGEGRLLGQAVELAFVGVHPAHEPVLGMSRRRTVVAMVVAVQYHFHAAPAATAAPKPNTKVTHTSVVV